MVKDLIYKKKSLYEWVTSACYRRGLRNGSEAPLLILRRSQCKYANFKTEISKIVSLQIKI